MSRQCSKHLWILNASSIIILGNTTFFHSILFFENDFKLPILVADEFFADVLVFPL